MPATANRYDEGRVDERTRRFLLPTRVIWISEEGVFGAEKLLSPNPENRTVCQLIPTENAIPGFVLDFGRERHGGIRLHVPQTSTGKPARIRVRFGESVTEAMGIPNNDHTIHDHEILVAWMGYTEVGSTGFRFVRIDLLDRDATVELASVEAVSLLREIPYLGSFACSDPRLNQIWETGAYTVHLCIQDQVWDGIKRDRLVWIGDLHPEAMVIARVFGAHALVPESLDAVRDRTLPGQWMNGISSYSLWWLLIQHDWYQYSGGTAYLSAQRDYLLSLLTQVMACVADDGQERLTGHRFLEWPTSDDQAATNAGLQALTVLALHAGARLCAALGESEAASQTRDVAERAAHAALRHSESKQAAALSVLAGMADATTTNAALLSQNPFRGLSTFYGYYVLQARAQAGDYVGCLDLIRAYWGGMLDAGATTFWEGFELDWLEGAGRIDEITPAGKRDIHADFGDWCYKGLRHSLCHGWAAGPTAWLSEHLLGMTPTAPGFATVRIQPQLGGLEWVRGTVPTPHGLIEIECAARPDGTTEITRLVLPEGVVWDSAETTPNAPTL